jgi:hypothetical protein|tara:strand:+ start:1794 stop:2087 length:294 start_codon:yes stop_codon:yes gene_type:complete
MGINEVLFIIIFLIIIFHILYSLYIAKSIAKKKKLSSPRTIGFFLGVLLRPLLLIWDREKEFKKSEPKLSQQIKIYKILSIIEIIVILGLILLIILL